MELAHRQTAGNPGRNPGTNLVGRTTPRTALPSGTFLFAEDDRLGPANRVGDQAFSAERSIASQSKDFPRPPLIVPAQVKRCQNGVVDTIRVDEHAKGPSEILIHAQNISRWHDR